MKHIASVLGIVAVVGVLVAGSHAIRSTGLHPRTADVIGSPSPSPVAGPLCVAPDSIQCSSPAPTTCMPGEGTQCPSDPVPITASPDPTSPPTDAPANTRAPAGQIGVSATWSVLPAHSGLGRMGVMVAVLSGGNWVSGAAVNAHCTGPGFDQTISGTTAPRASWTPTIDPNIPSGPGAFFWVVLHGDIDTQAAGAGKYGCHGNATYNGLAASF